MPSIFVNLLVVFALLFAGVAQATNEDEPIHVVASFSILGDWVKQLGGDQVVVTSLLGEDEDVHVYKATPRDMALLSKADLLVINGLGLEGWMNRIVDASGYSGVTLIASKGVDVIAMEDEGHADHDHSHAHDHGSHDNDEGNADPHAWTSLRQAVHYINNITAELMKLRPQAAEYFQKRNEDYIERINALDARATEVFSGIPDEGKNIVIPHNSFAYLARDYGFTVFSLTGMSTKSDTSARQVAEVVRKVRSMGITAIFSENIANTKLLEQLENETDVVISGTLISGALSKNKAPDYLGMMEYNLDVLTNAMGKVRIDSDSSPMPEDHPHHEEHEHEHHEHDHHDH